MRQETHIQGLPARKQTMGQHPGNPARAKPMQAAGVSLRLSLCLLLGLWGCAVGPDFKRPGPPPADRYTHGVEPTETPAAEGRSQHFERGTEIAAEWWHLFRLDELNALIAIAIAGNQDLAAAQARLRESQENLRAGYGAFLPRFDGEFDTTHQKFTAARFGGNFATKIFTLYTAAVSVSYDIDVFGGQRRAFEGLRAQADYQKYEVQATYLTLLGNVVNTTIAQAGYRAQIEATEEMIALQRDQLRITEAQAKAGMVPYANVLSVRSQLASTEAALPPLLQSLAKGRHLLATLVGRMPAEWTPTGSVARKPARLTRAPATRHSGGRGHASYRQRKHRRGHCGHASDRDPERNLWAVLGFVEHPVPGCEQLLVRGWKPGGPSPSRRNAVVQAQGGPGGL
jgi:NodT family efflux transporter outer membrane factor (OMF) lipoprotein